MFLCIPERSARDLDAAAAELFANETDPDVAEATYRKLIAAGVAAIPYLLKHAVPDAVMSEAACARLCPQVRESYVSPSKVAQRVRTHAGIALLGISRILGQEQLVYSGDELDGFVSVFFEYYFGNGERAGAGGDGELSRRIADCILDHYPDRFCSMDDAAQRDCERVQLHSDL